MIFSLKRKKERLRARRLLHGTDALEAENQATEPGNLSFSLSLFSPLKTFRLAESFESDYPAFLLALASAVKTGLDPVAAFCRTEELFMSGSVIRHELAKSRELLESGRSEEEVLRQFASTVAHPDLELFRTAFILSRKQGSSLAPCLHRLAKVTRRRQSFRRKMASAVAMQRLSAIGIAACASAMGIMQYITNPTAFAQALRDSTGSKALLLGAVLMTSGLSWMFFLTRRRI